MNGAAVLVVGGGPAGAAAARLLALWGHEVRLITRPHPAASPQLAESLPPSCRKLLDVIGVTADVDRASAVRSTGNTVWWGGDSTRVEPFAQGERGWQITASALGAALLGAARDAGVRVEESRVAAADLATIPDAFVLDCTGRAGLVARARGWRQYEASLKSVAVVGLWHHRAWPVPDDTHTLIESYADGWMWSVPVGDGRRYIAAMVDPRVSNLADDQARGVYLSELAKAPRFATITADAEFEGGPWGFDASMYSATRYAEERTLLVGDAGSFIDPLSSAGVKKALASAWLASVAVHTAIRNPAMTATAIAFFAAREAEIYRHFRRLTTRFLADAASGHADAFWKDRAELTGADDAQEPSADDIAAAFARIRSEATLRLRRGDAVSIELRPAVSGCEIVMEPRLLAPGLVPVRYVHDVDVVTLIELAPAAVDAGALFEQYVSRSGPVALPDFLRGLAMAVANGWLVWRD